MKLGTFHPIAYFDKRLDCIRVLTHDRSITEHRIDGLFTVFECNHRGEFDPRFVGFSIKGVRSLLAEAGLPMEGVYRLADLIDGLVKHRPGSTMSTMLAVIFEGYAMVGYLQIDFGRAA